jgi:transcription elongation factor GreB
MSKAFTSEETEDTSVSGRAPTRVPRGQEQPITPEGHKALVDELARLEATGRAEVRALPTEHEREQARRALEGRLAMLAATLESVRVVQPPERDDGVVRFGSVVSLAWADGKQQVVQLVGPDEADVKTGRLSIEAPLARALLDATQGATLEIERPRGVEEVTVVSVKPGC